MLLRHRIKRLRNMAQEAARLIRVRLLSWDSIRLSWRMHGLNPKRSGTAWREVELTYRMDLETAGRSPSPHHPRSEAFPNGYVERTETVRISRDYLDVIFDFVADYVVNLYQNIFVTTRCNHPHQHVRVEVDGDEEVGYVIQHRCNICRGYIAEEDVDQYLPEILRRPDLIMPANRPAFMDDEMFEKNKLSLENWQHS